MKSTWDFTNIEPFVYEQTGIGPVGRSYDVFGDGSVVLVNTPGHSHGLFSAKISSGGKYLILKSIQEKMIPGFTVDTGLARKSLEWICDYAADERCLLVAANHGIIIQEQTVEI